MNILRKPQVASKTGLSEPTIDRREANGEFPRRVHLGPNSTGWIEEEIDQWIRERPRGPLPEPRGLKENRVA